jgi:hypothetical protein
MRHPRWALAVGSQPSLREIWSHEAEEPGPVPVFTRTR